MGEKITNMETFYVAGIKVRTINSAGQAMLDIGELWGKFMGNNLAAEIPHKTSEDVYAVYTDYESDHNGFYTLVLGCKVSSVDGLTGGFTGVKIPAAKYRVYQPEGELPDSVVSAWEDIWETATERTFTSDFECYHTDENGSAQVEIFVAVK